MTPETPKPPANPKTTTAGIVAIISSALTLFAQIWGATQGTQIDPTQALGSIGAISAGVGLVKAKDAPKD